MKPRRWSILAASACVAGSSALAQVSTDQIERLSIGGQDYISTDAAVTRVALSDPAIANVSMVTPTRMRLVGLKAGNSDLTVWSKNDPDGKAYHITVGADVVGLKNALGAVPALRTVTAIPDSFGVELRGQVASLDAQQEALALAKNGKEPPIDQIAVADQRMVAVEVRFAAISTSTLRALGLNFQSLGSGFQFASGGPSSLSNVTFSAAQGLNFSSSLPLSQAFNLLLGLPGNNMMAAISALNSANMAQILAEPTLLVRSGEDADFLAGGEVPIPVPQPGLTTSAVTVEYRKYGVQLHLHATVLNGNRIVIRVNPEVSELDYQNAVTMQGFSVPAMTARSTDTTIELGDGQSFVLAGLMFSEQSSMEQKIPGIGNLPIIGDFFKQSQDSGDQEELVIIATPHLVSPMEANAVPKLPGEALSYAPTDAERLLNLRQLDNFAIHYGLATND